MLYYLSNAEFPSKKAHTIQQMRMCEAFVENGENVCFVHPSYGLNSHSISWNYLSDYYGLDSRFTIQSVLSLKDSSPLVPDVLEGVFKILSVNRWLLQRILMGHIDSSDIVYSRLFYPISVFSEWYNLIPEENRPVLIHEHHNPIESGFEDRIFDKLDGTVCLTKFLKTKMLAEGRGTDDSIMVAHDGVNLSPYEEITKPDAREELGFEQEDRLVMYTGHLYPRKGAHILVEAASQINAEVIIVGGDKEDIQRIKSEKEMSENVSFTGFVNPSVIHKYQISSDVLVAPYTDDAWMPSPLKLFEYMAGNSPIVASRIPTIEEVLEHKKDALLAPPGNSAELANAINTLLNERETAGRLNANARKKVESYTWSKRAKKILKFISNISD